MEETLCQGAGVFLLIAVRTPGTAAGGKVPDSNHPWMRVLGTKVKSSSCSFQVLSHESGSWSIRTLPHLPPRNIYQAALMY
jgi:hypothetical protein